MIFSELLAKKAYTVHIFPTQSFPQNRPLHGSNETHFLKVSYHTKFNKGLAAFNTFTTDKIQVLVLFVQSFEPALSIFINIQLTELFPNRTGNIIPLTGI